MKPVLSGIILLCSYFPHGPFLKRFPHTNSVCFSRFLSERITDHLFVYTAAGQKVKGSLPAGTRAQEHTDRATLGLRPQSAVAGRGH